MKNKDSIYYDEDESKYREVDMSGRRSCLFFLLISIFGTGIWIYLVVLFIKYIIQLIGG